MTDLFIRISHSIISIVWNCSVFIASNAYRDTRKHSFGDNQRAMTSTREKPFEFYFFSLRLCFAPFAVLFKIQKKEKKVSFQSSTNENYSHFVILFENGFSSNDKMHNFNLKAKNRFEYREFLWFRLKCAAKSIDWSMHRFRCLNFLARPSNRFAFFHTIRHRHTNAIRTNFEYCISRCCRSHCWRDLTWNFFFDRVNN